MYFAPPAIISLSARSHMSSPSPSPSPTLLFGHHRHPFVQVSAMLHPHSSPNGTEEYVPEHEELQAKIKQEMTQIKRLVEDYVRHCDGDGDGLGHHLRIGNGAADIFRQMGL